MIAALRQGLRERGWIEGRNIAFELRFAEGNLDRLADLATSLVSAQVNVIVTGSTAAALAAKKVTSVVPIVMVTTGDPVAEGVVDSLARPGGNITGVSAMGQYLTAKRLEILKEAIPSLARIAVLANPASPNTAPTSEAVATAAKALGLEVQMHTAGTAEEIDRAFPVMLAAHAQALIVIVDILFITHRARIVDLAAKSRLPTAFGERGSVTGGGLLFYGASLPGMYQRAAVHVDKILKGAKPGDLPVEQPTEFELVINLRTAKQLGVTISNSTLARADEVIE